MSLWRTLIRKFDERLTKWEHKGFRVANRLHKYAVNGCLLFIAYQFYTFMKSYNDYFLYIRQTNKFAETDLEGPINKEDA